jgi:hypothetical protein
MLTARAVAGADDACHWTPRTTAPGSTVACGQFDIVYQYCRITGRFPRLTVSEGDLIARGRGRGLFQEPLDQCLELGFGLGRIELALRVDQKVGG